VTERLYLADAGLAEADARVVAAGPEGVVLDRSPFYPRAGGQPGDQGWLRWPEGESVSEIAIADTVKGEGDAVLHVPAPGAALPAPGTPVRAVLDWPRRHRLMRMHTALHLLCAALPGAGVTGGQIGADRSRLDLDLPAAPDRAALEEVLAALVAGGHPVATEWVDEAVLDENPQLVRTLSVKPPRGAGRLRLVRIGAGDLPVDLQPCGGTHVASTADVGALRVAKVENKGRQNRRVVLELME
jgi:misacylated tRNA(Ala) deacylase